MNALLNALEELHDIIKSIENESCAIRIRRYLTDLLHKDEFNLDHNDPNHPYMQFARPGDDDEENALRLFQAMQECIDEEHSDLQACIDFMFDTPDTNAYNCMRRIMRRYMRYANQNREIDSDISSTDSD
jgi:hypothetical protein